MRTINTILAGMIISSTLFVSCTKEQYNVAAEPAPTNNTATANTGAGGGATAMAAAQTDYNMKFSAGYAMVTSMSMSSDDQYLAGASNQMINLFKPLTTADYPYLFGPRSNFLVKLSAAPSSGLPALAITGSYNNNGEMIPVEFRIDVPVKLRSMSTAKTVTEGMTIFDLLNGSTGALINGITPEMWRAALSTGRPVIISRSSNPDIYNMILSNLQGMMTVQFEAQP
jgi:hypothetical protein